MVPTAAQFVGALGIRKTRLLLSPGLRSME